MVTCPAVPVGTLTRFARVSPAFQLRLETSAAAAPAGVTFRKLEAVVFVTVTLSTTPLAVAGTPVVPPATVRSRDAPEPNVWVVSLVSRIRFGFCGVYAEPEAAATGRTVVVRTISPVRTPTNEKT
jgi:hypothetical protein